VLAVLRATRWPEMAAAVRDERAARPVELL